MTALTVTATMISESAEAGYAQRGDYNAAFNRNSQFLNLMSNYQQFMSKKFSSSKQSGNIYYVLTTIKGKDEKGAGLVGVNLYSGKAVNQIIFKDKSPDYEVDEAAGRLFNMNKGELSAYNITEQVEQTENKDEDNKKDNK